MAPQETLDRIARGMRVRVTGVRGDDAIARRLDDLGLRSGVVVEVLRRAPLGDPTVFELHGYQLCLRRSESARVEVELLAPATHDAAVAAIVEEAP
jgi:ferrous iron transport protein A